METNRRAIGRMAPKLRVLFDLFDSLGEQKVADTPVRELARQFSERTGQTVHQSTVADYRRLWQDHRDEIEREEKAVGDRFSINVMDELWRWPVDERGLTFAKVGAINSMVDHRAVPPEDAIQSVPSEYYSLTAIVRANAWRFSAADAVVALSTARELGA